MIQRKKHPKYRKPMSKQEKKKLKQAIQLKEKQNLKKILYSLPIDIKKKIYYFAVQSHFNKWSLQHKEKFSKIHSFINITENNTIDLDNGKWLTIGNDNNNDKRYYFSHKHLCSSNVRTKGQPNILSVFIHSNIYEEIDFRMWSNITDHYWVHEKCRCKMCDKIRLIGYKDLRDFKIKKKYRNIDWPIWSEQWRVKSDSQVKYDKNIERRIVRNTIQYMKNISLRELI